MLGTKRSLFTAWRRAVNLGAIFLNLTTAHYRLRKLSATKLEDILSSDFAARRR
jgi:hypothetical protein